MFNRPGYSMFQQQQGYSPLTVNRDGYSQGMQNMQQMPPRPMGMMGRPQMPPPRGMMGAQPGQPAPSWNQQAGGSFNPSMDFYNQVNQVLGPMQQAQRGDYANGWNQESSPNSRAQAQQWAQQMSQSLGRQLTPQELSQLQQRAQGWGFQQNTFNPATNNWGALMSDIGAIAGGQNIGQPSFAPVQGVDTNPATNIAMRQYGSSAWNNANGY